MDRLSKYIASGLTALCLTTTMQDSTYAGSNASNPSNFPITEKQYFKQLEKQYFKRPSPSLQIFNPKVPFRLQKPNK